MKIHKLSLGGQTKPDLSMSAEPGEGFEVPGMLSVYLATTANGQFFVREENGVPVTTPDWSKAKLMFVFSGLCEAREIAERWGGQVQIINCTSPTKYLG